jgi:hypothetical protein
MAASGTEAEIDGGGLRAAVARRSPTVAAALDEEQAAVRARAWAAREVPDSVVDAVRVRSVLYRPDGGCTLRYRVRLSPAGRERILLVEIPPAATDVVIRPFPADPGLPTLQRALDPDLMRGVLGRAIPGTGGERAIGRCAVDVVHHPRQGRCVLRYRLSLGAGGPGELRHPVVFGKVYGDDSAGAAALALRLLRHGLANLPDHVRFVVPQPSPSSPRCVWAWWRRCPGDRCCPTWSRPRAPRTHRPRPVRKRCPPPWRPRLGRPPPSTRATPREFRCRSGTSPASWRPPSGTSRCCSRCGQ